MEKRNFTLPKIYNVKTLPLIVLSVFNGVLKVIATIAFAYCIYFYFRSSIPYKKQHVGILIMSCSVAGAIFCLNLLINNYLLNVMCLDTKDQFGDFQLEFLAKKIVYIPYLGSFLMIFILKDKVALINKYKNIYRQDFKVNPNLATK
ncbi:hypothetical protein [Spiroplasma tabanidicola]|uniref:Transmembrane protein n=1 Tax=Spiroplasma tabanidicola TaxID=324079 RepID=A0A6I6CE40_9MOLU|nr:hypothetical protein [Spiroplasma tabanidicola]QGS52244.1 hypothetical protein STABA_v1c08890 [Spiroplasma tabanidicola]